MRSIRWHGRSHAILAGGLNCFDCSCCTREVFAMRFTTSVVAATAVLATANAAATPAKCNADNCLRAFRATQVPSRAESARAFCSSYTAAGATNVPVPTYAASGCKDNQNGKMNERISSACACLPSATSTTTAAPTKTAEPCALASADWASRVSASPSKFRCRRNAAIGLQQASRL